jgi:hypothetical protein
MDRPLALTLLIIVGATLTVLVWPEQRAGPDAAPSGIDRPPPPERAGGGPLHSGVLAADRSAGTPDGDALDMDPRRWSAAELDALFRRAGAGESWAQAELVAACTALAVCARVEQVLEGAFAAGHAVAALHLAALREELDPEGLDRSRWRHWMRAYGEHGGPEARLLAANQLLWDGSTDAETRALAQRWVVGLADIGEPAALLQVIASLEGWGEGLELAPDPDQAERRLRQVLESGDAQLLRAAAELHARALDAPEDITRIATLWAAAGDAGDDVGGNNAAWLLALCDGGRDAARRAQQLIARHHAQFGESAWSIDTLAMVQAVNGDLGLAYATQERALAALSGQDHPEYWAAEFRRRLEAYRRGVIPQEPQECGRPERHPRTTPAGERP